MGFIPFTRGTHLSFPKGRLCQIPRFMNMPCSALDHLCLWFWLEEAPDLLPLQHGPGGQGPGLRLLGAGLAGLALLPAGRGAAAGALAGQPAARDS